MEMLRQYAAERLEAAGEARRSAPTRHTFSGWLSRSRPDYGARSTRIGWGDARGERQRSRRPDWLIHADDHADEALTSAGSLGMYWHMGRHLEGRETLRRVLALPGGSPHARARALQAVSLVERPRACLVHPSAQCAAAADESLQIFEAIGDRRRAAFSRLLLSVEGVADTSRADMPALLEDADREFADLNDDWGQAVAGFVRMETLAKRGDEPGFRAASADATVRFRALADGWGLSAVLYHCGWALSRFGHHAEAVPVQKLAGAVLCRVGPRQDRAALNVPPQIVTEGGGCSVPTFGFLADRARVGSVSDQVRRRRVPQATGRRCSLNAEATSRRREHRLRQAYGAFQRLGVRRRPDWLYPAGRPARAGG